MKFNWANKIVIITGSGSGIGKTLAIEIGKKGAKIVLNGRNQEKLETAANELKKLNIEVLHLQGDISVFDECKNIVEKIINKFGKIDILINNAGIASFGSFDDIDIEVFSKVVNTNLLGSSNMTKAALPYLKKTEGSVFFIGSIAGIHGIGNYSAYSCSKMALTSLAESLKIELFASNIYVGIAYVGFTENDIQKTFLDSKGNTISVPSRKNIKQVPQLKVAQQIVKMIERRKFKKTFTFLGKLNSIVNRFAPFFIHHILLNQYRKAKEVS